MGTPYSETNDSGGAGASGLPTDAAHYFEHVFDQNDACAKNKMQSVAHNLGSVPRMVQIKCLIADDTKLHNPAQQYGQRWENGMETEFVSQDGASVNVTADATHIYYVVSKEGMFINYIGRAATGDHLIRSSGNGYTAGACHVVVRAWK